MRRASVKWLIHFFEHSYPPKTIRQKMHSLSMKLEATILVTSQLKDLRKIS